MCRISISHFWRDRGAHEVAIRATRRDAPATPSESPLSVSLAAGGAVDP
jgi:hypothetical protein